MIYYQIKSTSFFLPFNVSPSLTDFEDVFADAMTSPDKEKVKVFESKLKHDNKNEMFLFSQINDAYQKEVQVRDKIKQMSSHF